MKGVFVLTGDGSHTLYLPELKESYHSTNGAVTESMHVFIGAGLKSVHSREIHLLEIGFGTGLNAFLTLIEARKQNITIHYTGIELFPLGAEVYQNLNYPEILGEEFKFFFQQLHECKWGTPSSLAENFLLHKIKKDIIKEDIEGRFDLVYFDAFSPAIQPEMWTEKVLTKIYTRMNKSGVFVTYSSKGSVRRSLQDLGMRVERLPGPAGKREMIRAVKI